MAKLAGKVAVITGGNSGIGLATAQAFIQEGAKVAIFGRNAQTLDEAAQTLGEKSIAVQGDVTNSENLEALFTKTQNTFGKVDVLYINAGVAQFAPIEATSEEIFDHIMNVDFKGAYFTIQKALPHLNDGASIILTTSGANVLGMPGSSVYAASKAALRSLARTLSAELIGRGIRVNAVSPGPIETPIFGRMGLSAEEIEGFGQSVMQQVPMKRLGQPEEIAKAVLFLASSDSSYVLGIELTVDGGMTQL
jgi:NAD(P)-dependent dehydrogenase (short-subunit alcohol dehydrogenase family)